MVDPTLTVNAFVPSQWNTDTKPERNVRTMDMVVR